MFVGELDIKINRIEVSPGNFLHTAGMLEIHGSMPERDTGNRETFVFTQSLGHAEANMPMREIIRQALITFMTHEIEEQIYETQADGSETRPFDPHRPWGTFETVIKVPL